MRRTIFIFAFVVFLASAVGLYAQENEAQTAEFDFRNTRWGMTLEQVLAAESGEPITVYENATGFAYDKTVAELECYVVYVFADSLLVRTKYAFHEKHSNFSQFRLDREKLYNILCNKYGASDRNDAIFIDNEDYYRRNQDSIGRGYAIGDIRSIASWQTERNDIGLYFGGDNYAIELVIEYRSRSLADFADAVRKKEVSDDF